MLSLILTGAVAVCGLMLVLLDKRGAVRWRHSGAFNEDANKDLHAQVSGLLREP
jgi:hypothetical protein